MVQSSCFAVMLLQGTCILLYLELFRLCCKATSDGVKIELQSRSQSCLQRNSKPLTTHCRSVVEKIILLGDNQCSVVHVVLPRDQ